MGRACRWARRVLLVLGPMGTGTERSRRTAGEITGAGTASAHAKKAAAEGSGQTVRRGLVLTESHDRHATGRSHDTRVATGTGLVRSGIRRDARLKVSPAHSWHRVR